MVRPPLEESQRSAVGKHSVVIVLQNGEDDRCSNFHGSLHVGTLANINLNRNMSVSD